MSGNELPPSDSPRRQEGDIPPSTQNDAPADRNRWQRFRAGVQKGWPSVRRFALRALALLASFVLFLVVLVGVSAWYTSRSQFCNSCHIMEPYYQSWATSSHRDVPCIECHFEPGFGGKLRGKMLGLVQLAKYVTKTEGPRPSAEVSDASCLRSGCHETRLLSGKVEYRNIHFDHAPHLGQMRREKQLRCTSCHSQIVQGEHMSVTLSTCYLCHFKDEPFNEGLGACTHCHQIPEKEYDLGGGVKFTHELAFKKGVDCSACHLDVIRGKGDVPRERCLVCHNREGDVAQIKNPVFMHAKHVTEHKIDCLDCHLRIEHSLDQARIVHAASDCASCHPNHHQEQVAMFQGRGPHATAPHAGGMTLARLGCRTCHQLKEASATGTVLWKASADVCALCHEAAQVTKLKAYHAKLRDALPEIGSGLERLRGAVKSAPEQQAAELKSRMEGLEKDFAFLRAGNDIHNIHYASRLERDLLARVTALCKELKVAPPKVTLPAGEWK